MTDEFAGLCLKYYAIHGGEDQIDASTDDENSDIIRNFNGVFNQQKWQKEDE